MQADEYVTTLLEQIADKRAKEDIEEEVRQHIEEQTEYYRKSGMEEQAAQEAAVKEMGDPVEAGVELNRIHRPEMPWKMCALILLVSVVCFGIKLLFLKSGLSNDIRISFGKTNEIITREVIIMLMGYAVMFAVCVADYSIVGKYSRQLMFVLLLVVLLISRQTIYGDGEPYPVLIIGSISIAPIYPLMLAVPLFGGILYCHRRGDKKAVLKCIVWMLLPCFVTYHMYSQIGRTFLLFFMEFIMLVITLHMGWFDVNARKWIRLLVSGVTGIVVLLVGAVYSHSEFRRMMLLAWFRPQDYESGYQINAVREIVRGSRFAGSGTMEGGFSALWSVNRGYMLTFLMSEYGIAAMIIISVLFALLCVMLYRSVWKQKNQLGRLMGTACCIVLGVEILFYILSDLGIFYKAYTDCPFLSVRGFSCDFLNYFMLGILLSISRYRNVLPAHGPIAYPVKD